MSALAEDAAMVQTPPPATKKRSALQAGLEQDSALQAAAETPTPPRKRSALRAVLAPLGWLWSALRPQQRGIARRLFREEEDAEEDEPLCTAALADRRAKVFLVVGECGDGKSTLINALRDPERSGEASAGLNSRGVTKTIEAYVGRPIRGQPVDFLDTPGVGDTDVTPMKVLTLIEQQLVTDEVDGADAIDGVIVTTPVPDGRVKLGAQVVQMLVEHGFLGEDKWQNIILVGTKADRATEEELDLFHTDRVDDNGQPVGIAAQFFSMAPSGRGRFVTTSKGDYSELREAIASLPDVKVHYGIPDTTKMAEVFSQKLGINKELFQAELLASRKEIEAELSAQRAAVEQQRRAVEQQQRETEATAADTKLREAQLQRKLEEHERALEELRHLGPAERRRLEQEFQAQREEEQMELRLQMAQLRRTEQELQEALRQAHIQRARNYNFGEARGSATRPCRHRQTRRWANGHGRGLKCVDCKVNIEHVKY